MLTMLPTALTIAMHTSRMIRLMQHTFTTEYIKGTWSNHSNIRKTTRYSYTEEYLKQKARAELARDCNEAIDADPEHYAIDENLIEHHLRNINNLIDLRGMAIIRH